MPHGTMGTCFFAQLSDSGWGSPSPLQVTGLNHFVTRQEKHPLCTPFGAHGGAPGHQRRGGI